MTPLIPSLAAAALLTGAGLYAVTSTPDPVPADVPFAEERIDLPAVTLLDQRGEAHQLAELAAGALLVITFSYTTCDTICPLGNAIMAEVDAIAAGALSRPVRLLSITIDPVTDRPELLAEAAATFGAGEAWFWLTGEQAAIDRVLSALDATAADITLHDPIFLVGDSREGRFFRSLTMPSPDEIVAMLTALDV